MRLARPKEATLSEGRTVEMTVRLEQSGAIEGRFSRRERRRDARRAGASRASTRLNVGGHTALALSGASAATNDPGEFRLFNLPAREYYVVATYMRSQGRNDQAPQSGYANTYYPGSPALRGARVVVVRAGRDSERVNFTLVRRRLAWLWINPVDSGGVPLGREA